jgi:hypothetical protein
LAALTLILSAQVTFAAGNYLSLSKALQEEGRLPDWKAIQGHHDFLSIDESDTGFFDALKNLHNITLRFKPESPVKTITRISIEGLNLLVHAQRVLQEPPAGELKLSPHPGGPAQATIHEMFNNQKGKSDITTFPGQYFGPNGESIRGTMSLTKIGNMLILSSEPTLGPHTSVRPVVVHGYHTLK